MFFPVKLPRKSALAASMSCSTRLLVGLVDRLGDLASRRTRSVRIEVISSLLRPPSK